MADPFTVLSRELSKAERKLMLARILSSTEDQSPQEELLDDLEAPPALDLDDEYSRLSFFRRIIILIASFFSRRSITDLTEKLLLARIRAKVEAAAPGLVNFTAGTFTKAMQDELGALRPALSFLRSALGGIPRHRDFIAFLAGIELAPLSEQIMAETDPHEIFHNQFAMEERNIRAEMWRRFEQKMEDLTHEQKALVYRDLQRLETFDTLASIHIDDCLAFFGASGGAPKLTELSARLTQLSDCIHVVFHPPSTRAWSALFLYRSGEAMENPDFDLEKGSSAFIQRVAGACRIIQGFLKKVPLTEIMRCILHDISYTPAKPKGGEEWLVLLKSFWEDRMEKALRDFSRERRRDAVLGEARVMLGVGRLPRMDNYRPERHGKLFPARYESCLSFIRGFNQDLFIPRMDRYFKIVNLAGEFYKEENRDAFSSCYEKLAEAEDRVLRFDSSLTDEGERGAQIIKLSREGGIPENRAKLKAVVEEVDREAARLVDSAHSTYTQLSRILFGILYGEAGSPYDSLTNLRTIAGRENKVLQKSLEDSIKYLDQAASLLAQLKDIEMA